MAESAAASGAEMSTEDAAGDGVVVEDVAQGASAFHLLLACPAGVPASLVSLLSPYFFPPRLIEIERWHCFP